MEVEDQNGISTTEILVSGNIVGPLKINPKKLFAGNIKKGELTTLHLTISNLKNGSIFTIPTDNNSFNLKLLKQKKNSGEYSVQIRAPEKPGFFKGEIVIKTGMREQPFLYIPYAGFVRKNGV